MHDTFERALSAKTIPPDAELRPWLYRIATNLATDRLRRRRRVAFSPFSGKESDTKERSSEDHDLVRRALRAIPVDEAIALVLRLHEGFSRAEIAQLTRASERTVKDRLERGREHFAAAYRREVAE